MPRGLDPEDIFAGKRFDSPEDANPPDELLTDDLAYRMQQAAERHLDECWEAYYAAEEEPDPDKWPPSPAIGPFCGCQTCLVREVLHAGWRVFEEQHGP